MHGHMTTRARARVQHTFVPPLCPSPPRVLCRCELVVVDITTNVFYVMCSTCTHPAAAAPATNIATSHTRHTVHTHTAHNKHTVLRTPPPAGSIYVRRASTLSTRCVIGLSFGGPLWQIKWNAGPGRSAASEYEDVCGGWWGMGVVGCVLYREGRVGGNLGNAGSCVLIGMHSAIVNINAAVYK